MSAFSPFFTRDGMRLSLRRLSVSAGCLGMLAMTLCVADAQEPAAAAGAKAESTPVNLAGLVADASGAPLSKATVYIYTAAPRVGTSPFCPSCYVDCGKRQLTDGKGSFSIPSVDSKLIFRLLVVEDGYEPLLVPNVDPLKSPIKVALKKEAPNSHDPKGQVKGRVVDKDGRPVAGATVEPIGLKTGDVTRYGGIPGLAPLAVTNTQGEFRFDCPKGSTMLTTLVKARGLAPRVASDLHPGARTPQVVPMAVGTTVEGTVQNAAGHKLTGVVVQLVPVDRNAATFTGWAEIGTDEKGRFSLPNVPADRKYVVCVRMSSLAEKGVGIGRQTISTGKEESTTEGVNLTVQPAVTLTGRVVLTDGKPIRSGTRIMLGRAETWDEQQVVLGADGSFTFQGVPAGEDMEFAIQVPGYHYAQDNPGFEVSPYDVAFKTAANASKSEVKIRMEPDAK